MFKHEDRDQSLLLQQDHLRRQERQEELALYLLSGAALSESLKEDLLEVESPTAVLVEEHPPLAQVHQETCPCTGADFFCAEGFYRRGQECVATNSKDAPDVIDVNIRCSKLPWWQQGFIVSQGYEGMPGNSCVDQALVQHTSVKVNKNNNTRSWSRFAPYRVTCVEHNVEHWLAQTLYYRFIYSLVLESCRRRTQSHASAGPIPSKIDVVHECMKHPAQIWSWIGACASLLVFLTMGTVYALWRAYVFVDWGISVVVREVGFQFLHLQDELAYLWKKKDKGGPRRRKYSYDAEDDADFEDEREQLLNYTVQRRTRGGNNDNSSRMFSKREQQEGAARGHSTRLRAEQRKRRASPSRLCAHQRPTEEEETAVDETRPAVPRSRMLLTDNHRSSNDLFSRKRTDTGGSSAKTRVLDVEHDDHDEQGRSNSLPSSSTSTASSSSSIIGRNSSVTSSCGSASPSTPYDLNKNHSRKTSSSTSSWMNQEEEENKKINLFTTTIEIPPLLGVSSNKGRSGEEADHDHGGHGHGHDHLRSAGDGHGEGHGHGDGRLLQEADGRLLSMGSDDSTTSSASASAASSSTSSPRSYFGTDIFSF
ncbi:unnamed protein product [Amoebophrya sp. A25]|nr:unnamed protein product [Amoebophrya sp. A25]|eukprot:GSA25T00014740001.1